MTAAIIITTSGLALAAFHALAERDCGLSVEADDDLLVCWRRRAVARRAADFFELML